MEKQNIMSKTKFNNEDCENLLKSKFKHKKYKSFNFIVEPVEEKCGYFADHFKISIIITFEEENEQIFCFSKCLPSMESGIDLELALIAFRKEVFTYEGLFENIINSEIMLLKNIVPKCFYTKSNFMLVFEDLSKEGYKQIPRYDYLNYDHVIIIIKNLAKLHASSLIYEEKKGHCLETLFSEYEETFYSEKDGHKGTASLFAALKGLYTEVDIFNIPCNTFAKEEFKKKLKKVCYKMLDLVKPSKIYRNTICHGDLWQTNFMMKYKENKPIQCAIIDFQSVRFSPPAHDVVAFLYLTTSPDFRKLHFENIIEFYYSELSKNVLSYGVDLSQIITYKDFINSCEVQKIFGAMQAATYFQLTHVKSDSIAKLTKDNEKWEKALYEDHSILILENYEHDVEYRYRLEESLKDLYDIIESNSNF